MRGSRLKILIVEDSKLFGSVVKQKLETEAGFSAYWVSSLAEARATLEQEDATSFFLAVLDLNLPDAPGGEVVDMVQSYGVPAVVLTAQLNDELRDNIWSKNVVDYVLKEGPQSIDHVVSLVQRLAQNDQIKILIVDDAALSRLYFSNLLTVHRYQVLMARSGTEALEILRAQPDIRLMIVDYNMPEMDGDTLTKKVRVHFSREELSIIGVSAQNSGYLSARFIKSGANDFIYKPFVSEELYCRVTQNLLTQEYVRTLEDLVNKDYMTGLYNRRFFFAMGEKLFANAKRGNLQISVAMIDIDLFKKINDTYGHDAGDEVIKAVAAQLAQRFRSSDIVSRFGGEEFCIVLANMDPQHAPRIFDEIRAAIAQLAVPAAEETISVTVSIGVTMDLAESLDAMIVQADRMLYEAKKKGRNRVICS